MVALNTDLNILIVDDNEINLFMMRDILESLGFTQLETAFSGFEALEAVKRQAIDLILMDISMPEMDGYEATAQIRKLGFAGKIFALTATQICATSIRYLESGLDGILLKPIDLDAVIKALSAERT